MTCTEKVSNFYWIILENSSKHHCFTRQIAFFKNRWVPILCDFWKPMFPRFDRLHLKFILRWGWVFLERTRILNGIQFTTHFIEFFVVEMKRFVRSFVNVVLTRQTCGQRSRQGCGKQTPSARKLFYRANLLYVPNIKM